jgi:hypothetical protein
MKRLLSLFDTTGRWPEPFTENGWDVQNIDIQNWISIDINTITTAEEALEVFGDIDGILAAPPCTDYSVSGAQYWKKKDEDGRTEMSNELVRQVLRLVDLYYPTDPEYDGTFFFAIENPVGRIGRLFPEIGRPQIYFNPCEFAGWLDLPSKTRERLNGIRMKRGIGITAEEAELILATETYTKRTGIWGAFRVPEKRPILAVQGAPQGSVLQRAGGKSLATKNMRSATPLGFARAFYEANYNYRPKAWTGAFTHNDQE